MTSNPPREPKTASDGLVRTLNRLGSELDLITVLTLLLLLLYAPGPGYTRASLTVTAVVGIVDRRIRVTAGFWLAITGLVFYGIWQTRFWADNHHFLIGYWCLALGLASLAPDPRRALATNARLLVGLSLGFAVFWKTLAHDYLDGRFFVYELLFDARFSWLAKHLAGVQRETVELNRSAIAALTAYDGTLSSVPLEGATNVAGLASTMTYGIYVIELVVALAFLSPVRGSLDKLRHIALLLFLLGTYAIAPVFGFGWLLAIMGLSCTPKECDGMRTLYFATIVVIQFYSVVWSIVA